MAAIKLRLNKLVYGKRKDSLVGRPRVRVALFMMEADGTALACPLFRYFFSPFFIKAKPAMTHTIDGKNAPTA